MDFNKKKFGESHYLRKYKNGIGKFFGQFSPGIWDFEKSIFFVFQSQFYQSITIKLIRFPIYEECSYLNGFVFITNIAIFSKKKKIIYKIVARNGNFSKSHTFGEIWQKNFSMSILYFAMYWLHQKTFC